MTDITLTAVVGNPRPGSRTLKVARAVVAAIAESLQSVDRDPSIEVIDLAVYGPRVLDPEDAEIDRALARTLQSGIVVAASPTYKATYTGLLKAFFDRAQGAGLAGTVAVPVMVGAAPIHYMAVEMHLRPLLVELGASCPTAGLFVVERQLDDLADAVGKWLLFAAQQLVAATALTEPVHH
jgi:FMN reductase